MVKRNGVGKGILLSALTAAMVFTGIPVYASPARQDAGEQEKKVLLPGKETVTSIDFTEMESLDSLPEGWILSNGSGSSALVDDEGGKALKMTRLQDGGELSLANSSLDIRERVPLCYDRYEDQGVIRGICKSVQHALYPKQQWSYGLYPLYK